MAQQVALKQLTEMGIPVGRAKAALERTKGDAMSAAERVFGGDFDDIPSDDDADDFLGESSRGTNQTGFRTPEEQPFVERVQRIVTLEDRDNEVDGSDEGSYEFEDYEDDAQGDNHIQSDPYAGIFFSKDRVEQVIEPVDEPEYVVMDDDGGNVKVTVRLLDRSEWMSGCPEGNEQSFLFQLYSTLNEDFPCSHGCGQTLKRRKEDFFCLFSDFPRYARHISSIVRPICPRCQGMSCLACGEKTDDDAPSVSAGGKGKGRSLEDDRLLHCLNMQGLLIGVGLHMIQEAFATGKSQSIHIPGSRKPPAKKRKTGVISKKKKVSSVLGSMGLAVPAHVVTPEPDELDEDDHNPHGGAHSSQAKGVGYAGSTHEDHSWRLAAQQAQEEADKRTASLLAHVKVYLPQLNRASGTRTSDHMVHPTTLAHLRRRSGFVNDLLRNDSLLDMSGRGDLYRTLFDWLEVISSHEALASLLAMPQMRPTKIEPGQDDNTVRITYEGASSPRELLESCVIQAQAALKGLRSTSVEETTGSPTEEEKRLSATEAANKALKRIEEESNDENRVLKAFCERIVACAAAIDRSIKEVKGQPFLDRMKESLPKLPDVGEAVEQDIAAGSSEAATIAIYERWAGRARFQYCDMAAPSSSSATEISYRHAFSGQLTSLEMNDAPKRSLAIAKELAILTTALPVAWHSTIFLRVDESRVDCIKAMIIGPEGTPYENGCFIFDIFLPLDYNIRNPSVKSMTTNGGKYRYNPNLYADGKVCLSLLGTWTGPGWIAGQSTLLQVLISIQSLILCEEPYCNEPGWAQGSGSTGSKSYSANVRRMTIADAMANNIKTPPYPFENEIKTHFRLKSQWIRKQLDRWKALDDGHPISGDSYSPGVRSRDSKPSERAEGSQVPFDQYADELRQLLDELDTK
ncbi:hypothetical protein BCR39DRAFT_513852 [Naematelia encephala]|uniref:UBC core domain-containing protein n=1 Tax=Naematelia encephala TaxID=71784 RepID=A0A1Y2BIQ5_9TREE|nr:hypothetical protein BCR39DRAFT_513852 [Naematelia encephala]